MAWNRLEAGEAPSPKNLQGLVYAGTGPGPKQKPSTGSAHPTFTAIYVTSTATLASQCDATGCTAHNTTQVQLFTTERWHTSPALNALGALSATLR